MNVHQLGACSLGGYYVRDDRRSGVTDRARRSPDGQAEYCDDRPHCKFGFARAAQLPLVIRIASIRAGESCPRLAGGPGVTSRNFGDIEAFEIPWALRM